MIAAFSFRFMIKADAGTNTLRKQKAPLSVKASAKGESHRKRRLISILLSITDRVSA